MGSQCRVLLESNQCAFGHFRRKLLHGAVQLLKQPAVVSRERRVLTQRRPAETNDNKANPRCE